MKMKKIAVNDLKINNYYCYETMLIVLAISNTFSIILGGTKWNRNVLLLLVQETA